MTPRATNSSYRIKFHDTYDICLIYLRGAVPDADILANSVSHLSALQTSQSNSDCADTVDDKEAQNLKDAENVAEEPVEVRATKIISRMENAMERLDLDAIFGMGATDLDDEDEEAVMTTAGSSDNFEMANQENSISTSTTSILRNYLREDLSDEISDFYNNNLPTEFHEDSQIASFWSLSVANIEWRHMRQASEMLKDQGAYVPKSIKEADRSRDWFWENGRPLYSQRLPSVPVVSAEVKPAFHHLNFQGFPVYHKSSTPPEVSLWLAFTAHRKRLYHDFSRQGVITSQATKLMDPFMFSGREHLLKGSGSQLRDAVIGCVHKAYKGEGTWLSDRYDDDEQEPINSDIEKGHVYKYRDAAGDVQYPLQVPHEMSPADYDEVSFNDGEDSYTREPTRWDSYKAYRCAVPSRLCIVESADYGSFGEEPLIPCLQSAEEASAVVEVKLIDGEVNIICGQADEDIEAENHDFYGSCGSASSHDEASTTEPKPATKPDSGDLLAEGLESSAEFQEASWEVVLDGLRALKPFIDRKFDFQATGEEDLEDASEVFQDGICFLLFQMSQLLILPDIEIPFKPGFNEKFYGPLAIAVGHKAFELAGRVFSRLW